MAVIVELPADIEERLRSSSRDLETEGKEAMLIELYRQDKVTRYDLSLALDLNRFEVDGLLNKHGVTEDLPSLEEFEQDYQLLKRLLDR